MAKITNHKTSQIDFTLLPSTPISIDLIDSSKIKNKMIDLWAGSKPVVTHFSQLLNVYEPQKNINLTIFQEQNRITIADQSVEEYSSKEFDSFVELVFDSVENIKSDSDVELKAYGLNINSVFDIENGEDIDSGDYIFNNFMETDSFTELSESIKSGSVAVVYEEDGTRYQLRLDPRYNKDLLQTNSILVNFNAHIKADVPVYSELLPWAQKVYNDHSTNLAKLIK